MAPLLCSVSLSSKCARAPWCRRFVVWGSTVGVRAMFCYQWAVLKPWIGMCMPCHCVILLWCSTRRGCAQRGLSAAAAGREAHPRGIRLHPRRGHPSRDVACGCTVRKREGEHVKSPAAELFCAEASSGATKSSNRELGRAHRALFTRLAATMSTD